MSALSNNQVRHMYIVQSASAESSPKNFAENATIGQAGVFNELGAKTAGNMAYVLYKNNKGYISKTDNIEKGNVVYAKTTDYKAESFKKYTITPTNIQEGDKFVLLIQFLNWYSVSPENQYFKQASYTAKAGDDAEAVVDGLVKNLAWQFKHETVHFAGSFKYTPKGVSPVQYPANDFLEFSKDGATTDAKLIIQEKEQRSNKDKIPAKKLMFYISAPDNEDFGTMDIKDTFVTKDGSTVNYHSLGVNTGKTISEQEWFYLGERGDIYRYMGYPNNFETKYDAKDNIGYISIDVQYFYTGSAEDVQKSQKQLYLVFPFTLEENGTAESVSYAAAKAAAKTISDTLGTVLGITINSLS